MRIPRSPPWRYVWLFGASWNALFKPSPATIVAFIVVLAGTIALIYHDRRIAGVRLPRTR